MPCSTCNDDGQLCLDCGSIDQAAIGRKVLYLMRHDRPTLLAILRGTPRQQWLLLAQAYVKALGLTEQGQAVPALGVVSLWGMLVREVAGPPAPPHPIVRAADASAESYAKVL